jgi:DNA (cytosine-5)-methyltransferase 1
MQESEISKAPRKLCSLELFAGAGGLALGTARAGFEHAAVIDLHAESCETLRQNKRNNVAHVRDWEILETDISDLDFSGYAGIDLLSGGPPCQPFSQAGNWSEQEVEKLWSEEALTAAVLPRYHVDERIKRSLGSKLGTLKDKEMV